MISNILKYHGAKGPKKWILWLLISVGVLVATLAIYIRLNKRKHEIVKLHKEADLMNLKVEQVRFDMIHEKNAVKLADLLIQAQELQKAAVAKSAEIAENEKAFEAEFKQVKALESWKDLDAYNQKSRS